MLSRHFIRAKVLQELYACQYGEKSGVLEADKSLMHNIARLNDLGILQASTIIEFVAAAERVLDEGMQKFMPTEAEKNPDRTLLGNDFVRRMADNFELKKQIERANAHWSDEQNIFRKAFIAFRELDVYKDYVAGARSFENDRAIALQIFKYMMNDEALRAAIYERSLLWEDDFDQVAQYIFMMLKALDEELMDESMPWPAVYDDRNEEEREAMEFARGLLKESLLTRQQCDEMIKKHLRGWEFERVAPMDVLLLNMAMAELTSCPSIPERVTVNEYIELSKEFSTDRSKLFINGLLDKVIIELRSSGKIVKSGRGLLDLDILEEEKD